MQKTWLNSIIKWLTALEKRFLSHLGLNVQPCFLTASRAQLNLWQRVQLLQVTCCRVLCAEEVQVQGKFRGEEASKHRPVLPDDSYTDVAKSSDYAVSGNLISKVILLAFH